MGRADEIGFVMPQVFSVVAMATRGGDVANASISSYPPAEWIVNRVRVGRPSVIRGIRVNKDAVKSQTGSQISETAGRQRETDRRRAEMIS